MQVPSDATALPPQLTPVEARILGSLAEKAATTPDVYPLTVNNIQLACNQKTARDPVTSYDTGEIGHALRQMEPRGLVKSEYGARAERYRHKLERVYDLTAAQTALVALLLLRGPQTLHELLTRSERLHRFAGIDDVRHALERLAEREKPLVRLMPRAAGQREDRYAHLLCGEPAMPERLADTAPPRAAHDDGVVDTLLARIEALEARVAALEGRAGDATDAT
ncbi:MAG: YceH family protein [Lysobacteraceae bacterium]